MDGAGHDLVTAYAALRPDGAMVADGGEQRSREFTRSKHRVRWCENG